MFKQIVLLLVLSACIVLGMVYAQMGVQWLIAGHDWIANILTNVFSGSQAGDIARNLIALLSIPVIVGLVPAILYWAVRRHWFPYFMEIVWVVWLVQAGALVMAYHASAIA